MLNCATDSLNLIFDADDTLWDSNIHFLEAFDNCAAAVGHAGLGPTRVEIQAAVRRAEIMLIKTHGYGRRPYVRALHQAADELAPAGDDGLREEIERIGAHLLERDCALLPDVEPTLQQLSQRHRLLMFTKGQRDEQLQKLARSGLGPLFDRVETPREKDVDAYRRLVRDADLDPSLTFMIGNSPRSDINPAVAAGLRAVFIPHPHTWQLAPEVTNQQAPGTVFLTGSSFSGPDTMHRYLGAFRDALKNLRPKSGLFAILGNHDHWSSAERITEALKRAGADVLANDSRRLFLRNEKLTVVGIDDLWSRRAEPARAFGDVNSDDATIVLAHNPDTALYARHLRPGVMLSGRTHGGVVRIPFSGSALKSILRIGKEFYSGLNKYEDFYIYTNRGLGTFWLRIRINCPPEVSRFSLTPLVETALAEKPTAKLHPLKRVPRRRAQRSVTHRPHRKQH